MTPDHPAAAGPADVPDEEGTPLPAHLRALLDELELYLAQQPDADLAQHGVMVATRLVLEDVPGLELERYDEEAKIFVLATPIWDRVLTRFPQDVAYWMSQRLMMNENHEAEPERAAELLAAAKQAIAERADLLERQGYPHTARSFRAVLHESAGGEPPADIVWNGLALRIAEPYLADPVNVLLGSTPSQPPSTPPAPGRE
jgi:hypothetical protein